ncbi:MAG TPA: hypothetical protein VNC78_01345 [Actinomycetota bacterium]|nr:hypothetical protein [Actinomycetota bacterium]
MRSKRLSKGEQTVLAASLVLFLLSFIPGWARLAAEAEQLVLSPSYASGWGSFGFIANLALLIAGSVSLLIVLKLVGVELELPLRHSGYAVLTGAIAVFLLVALIGGPEDHDAQGTYVTTRGPLVYVGALLAVLGVAGAQLHRREVSARPAGGRENLIERGRQSIAAASPRTEKGE